MRSLYDFLFKNISHHGSFLLLSYKWMDWVWDGLDLCAGLLYEHRFAMLKSGEVISDQFEPLKMFSLWEKLLKRSQTWNVNFSQLIPFFSEGVPYLLFISSVCPSIKSTITSVQKAVYHCRHGGTASKGTWQQSQYSINILAQYVQYSINIFSLTMSIFNQYTFFHNMFDIDADKFSQGDTNKWNIRGRRNVCHER